MLSEVKAQAKNVGIDINISKKIMTKQLKFLKAPTIDRKHNYTNTN